MAKIAEIKTRVTADNKQFKRSMKQSKKAAGSFGKSVGAAGAALKGLVLVAGARAIVAGVTKQFDAMDRIAKRATAIGVEVRKFSSVELGLKLAGMNDMAAFEKGVKSIAVALDAAKAGTGTASRALKTLGMTVDDLKGDPIETMKSVADGLKRISDPAERLAAANAILGGRAALDLMPWLLTGREGIEAFIKESEQLGGVITEQQAQVVQQANDDMLRLKTIWTGTFRDIAASVAPEISAMGQTITFMLTGIDTELTAIQKRITETRRMGGGGPDSDGKAFDPGGKKAAAKAAAESAAKLQDIISGGKSGGATMADVRARLGLEDPEESIAEFQSRERKERISNANAAGGEGGSALGFAAEQAMKAGQRAKRNQPAIARRLRAEKRRRAQFNRGREAGRAARRAMDAAEAPIAAVMEERIDARQQRRRARITELKQAAADTFADPFKAKAARGQLSAMARKAGKQRRDEQMAAKKKDELAKKSNELFTKIHRDVHKIRTGKFIAHAV